MPSEWKLIARPGVVALERFLASREPAATVVSDRVRHTDFDRRLRNGGRCYYVPGTALVYQGPGGFLAPVGIDALEDIERRTHLMADIRRLVGANLRIHSIMGARGDVSLLQETFASRAIHVVDYDLLALPWMRFPPVTAPPHPELRLIRPRPDQWRRLLQLQIAYEVEEVLLPGRSPNPATSRATLEHSLKTQTVLVATHQGSPVARVATNARGYTSEQIGGVYTDPVWRNRGVSRWLMAHLLDDLRRRTVNASLFVKLDNHPAQELYRSLGFSFESPFRISYYH
jgi:GNAT superfamily N-acetyltransferase